MVAMDVAFDTENNFTILLVNFYAFNGQPSRDVTGNEEKNR